MMVRRYVVKDMPEAVVSIRKELGKDAVILSTKRIRVRKWLGLRWQTRLEVMAAVGDDIPLQHRAPQPSPAASSKQPSSTAATEDGLHTVLEELGSLKEMLSKAQSEPELPLARTGALEDCRQLLLGEGFARAQVDRWLVQVGAQLSPTATSAEILQHISQQLLQEIGDLNEPQPIATTSRIVSFIGSTGVGKTTSIAKIAALHVLAGKRKVGLLTTDTFRIAAVQQLQTYADILGIPLVVANDIEEMAEALAKLAACDLILVDTAGRNFRDAKTVDYTKRLMTSLQPDEIILVLSLTTKAADADALAETCEQFSFHKFLFTKLDETETRGTILRLMAKYQRPLSYLTMGQNVPDDIDMISAAELASSLWEVSDHG